MAENSEEIGLPTPEEMRDEERIEWVKGMAVELAPVALELWKISHGQTVGGYAVSLANGIWKYSEALRGTALVSESDDKP